MGIENKTAASAPNSATATDEKVPELKELIKKAGDLNMMPQVAKKVIELVSDQNSNAVQLATLIEKDPNITTRILKIANSAFYGLRSQCKTVQQAIVILGFKSLRSLVVASSSKALHKRFGITEQLMWDHSIGTAIAAKLLSQGRPSAVGEMAFVGGLLHNVGKTVLNNECPKLYMEVMKLVYNQRMSSSQAENAIFGYNHSEVGFEISKLWGLPNDLSSLIRFHNLTDLTEAEREPLYKEAQLKLALACVECATQLCRKLGIGYRDKHENINILELEGGKVLGLNEQQVTDWIKKAEESYKKERAIFN